MITNRKHLFLNIGVIVLLLLLNFKSYGQAKIEYSEIVEVNGSTDESIIISITENLSKRKDVEVTAGTKLYNGTFIKVPKKTILAIKTSKALITIVTVNYERIFELTLSSPRDIIKARDKDEIKDDLVSNIGRILVNKFKKATGTTVGIENATGSQNTNASNTIWEVQNNGTNLIAKHIEGKVSLNYRYKIEMEDSIVNFNDSKKRVLYLTRRVDSVKYLSAKDTLYAFNPDRLKKPQLNTEESIYNFFKNELRKQTRFLKSSGPFSKRGFKAMSNGQNEEGIAEYKKAIDSGEMSSERFIQASLILSEANHEMNAKKNIANSGLQQRKTNKHGWLEASIQFIQDEDSIRKEKYEFYTNKEFKKEDYKDIVNALGQDFILSKQYLAWAYTVKLKFNGCLESSDQNPKIILEEAKKIKDELGLSSKN